MSERLPLRVGIGVGLVAGCVLALQVLLTRLFSAALFYHFTFLAISLALLGAGAGAIAVYVRPTWFGGDVRVQLVRWAAILSILLVVLPLLLVRLHFAVNGALTTGFVARLAAASVLTTLMFLAGGITIALAVRAYTDNISRLYAMDLAGAALGAVAVVPLMWVTSVPTLVVALGAGRGARGAAVLRTVRPARMAAGAARRRDRRGRAGRLDAGLPPAAEHRGVGRRQAGRRRVDAAEPSRRLRAAAARAVRHAVLRQGLRAGCRLPARDADARLAQAAPRAADDRLRDDAAPQRAGDRRRRRARHSQRADPGDASTST